MRFALLLLAVFILSFSVSSLAVIVTFLLGRPVWVVIAVALPAGTLAGGIGAWRANGGDVRQTVIIARIRVADALYRLSELVGNPRCYRCGKRMGRHWWRWPRDVRVCADCHLRQLRNVEVER